MRGVKFRHSITDPKDHLEAHSAPGGLGLAPRPRAHAAHVVVRPRRRYNITGHLAVLQAKSAQSTPNALLAATLLRHFEIQHPAQHDTLEF